jgi:caffeoyl-CoA O-methyltransferase
MVDYLVNVSVTEPAVLARLRERTRSLPGATMQISPEQGQFMRLLVQLLGARRTIEVGVYTGYSSTCVALELPDDGELLACDKDPETTAIAAEYWREAGVYHKIQLHLGRAEDTLRQLLGKGAASSYDFAFIDADKTSSDTYYEFCLQLLRPGGLIAIDNALWHGRVADLACNDDDTVAIRHLNAKVASDSRVSSSLIPIGDGLLLARKRSH